MVTKPLAAAATATLVFAQACAETSETPVTPVAFTNAHGAIVNNAGEEIGSVHMVQGQRGVVVTLKARDLPPGKHGMHFHAVGACTPLDKFSDAGGHIMPKELPHGFLHPEGPHAGNLPNLIVAADGTVEVELYTNLLMLDQGEGMILDEDGSTLIIHTNEDDHATQPIGGAGGRIACAVIEPVGGE